MSKGAPSWFQNVSTYVGEKLFEYWTIFCIENSFKSKLKIIKEFDLTLDGIVGKPWVSEWVSEW